MRKLYKILIFLWEFKKIKESQFKLGIIKETSIILGCFVTVFGSKRYKYNLYAEKTGVLLAENVKYQKTKAIIRELKEKARKSGKTIEEYLEDLATAVRKGKNNNIIAKFIKGNSLELVGKRFDNFFGGGLISLYPDRTVAITGILKDVSIVKGFGFKGLWRQGNNPGGLDILSSPIWWKLKEKYKLLEETNNKLFWKKVTQDFWDLANKPWLDDIIARGDDVRFVTNPNLEKSKYIFDSKLKEYVKDEFGKRVPTIFSQEIEYLKKNGYEIIDHIAKKVN
ncbi:MAG: hypothetical protein AB8B65_11955 [Kordia sp.]|uniref:hypothetical protein n=1 Tax=Kordia sp. TaxID=1965332 RepID=UPI003859E107